MAYNELIKNFQRIRDYMRDFYVYGFKSREQYDRKSSRSYDDERRRIESWLGAHTGFRRTPEGKNIFISIDTRIRRHNPFYKAWKAKSFTDGDITLHFAILDILSDPVTRLTAAEITETIDERYLSMFSEPKLFDGSTVRKKLKEYEGLGLLKSEKDGRIVLYSRKEDDQPVPSEVLDFFSEAVPCGVIGSFLLDRAPEHEDSFAFKHHYISHTLDSEILGELFEAMHEKREITILNLSRRSDEPRSISLVPIRIYISVQSGRQYLMAYMRGGGRITSFRLDHIISVEKGEMAPDFDLWREKLDGMKDRMWGISTQGRGGRTEKVEFTISYDSSEAHIFNRLMREKRCGTVTVLDDSHLRFSAEVFDVNEMLPWIRTFICRIEDIHFSNSETGRRFRNDLEQMYAMYGIEGGGNDDIQ